MHVHTKSFESYKSWEIRYGVGKTASVLGGWASGSDR